MDNYIDRFGTPYAYDLGQTSADWLHPSDINKESATLMRLSNKKTRRDGFFKSPNRRSIRQTGLLRLEKGGLR
jgi:hypothetical protein